MADDTDEPLLLNKLRPRSLLPLLLLPWWMCWWETATGAGAWIAIGAGAGKATGPGKAIGAGAATIGLQ